MQYKYFIFPLMNAYTAESQMYTTKLKNAEMLQEFGGDVAILLILAENTIVKCHNFTQ